MGESAGYMTTISMLEHYQKTLKSIIIIKLMLIAKPFTPKDFSMSKTLFSDEEHSANDVPQLMQSKEWAAYHGTGNTLKLNRSKTHEKANQPNQQRLFTKTREDR